MYNLGEVLASSLLTGIIDGIKMLWNAVWNIIVDNPLMFLAIIGLMFFNRAVRKFRW